MIFLRRRIGLIGLILITLAVMVVLSAKDRQWTVWLHAHESRALVEIMGRTVFEGDLPGANDPIILYFLGVIIAYHLAWRRPDLKAVLAWRPHTGFMLCSAVVGGIYLTHGLKWMVGRARPSLVLSHGWPFTPWYEFGPHFINEGIFRGSFPSGHTAQALILMALAYALAGDPTRRRLHRLAGWLVGIAVTAFTVTMGVARCMSLNHWATDVAGSMFLGWISMHWLYFDVLRVPEQRQYQVLYGQPPLMPRAWELRLTAYGLALTLGIMMMVIGGRSLVILHVSWMLVLVPLGLAVSWTALKRIFQILNLLNTGLRAVSGS